MFVSSCCNFQITNINNNKNFKNILLFAVFHKICLRGISRYIITVIYFSIYQQ